MVRWCFSLASCYLLLPLVLCFAKWNGMTRIMTKKKVKAAFRRAEKNRSRLSYFLGEEEDIENGNETPSTALAPSEASEAPVDTTNPLQTKTEAEQQAIRPTSNTPPATHKPSITDDLVFYDPFSKQEMLDQYSKSEICLPLAVREQLEQEYRAHRLGLEKDQEDRTFPDQQLSSSTTQIEQTDEKDRATEVPAIVERSNSCKSVVRPDLFFIEVSLSSHCRDLTLTDSTPLANNKSARPNIGPSASTNARKTRPHYRRPRVVSTNAAHDNKQLTFYFPLHHQHHNVPMAVGASARAHPAHHHHHHAPLHFNRGNLSQLALCSKNIYNYESVLNICKLQSLHFSIDRSLSLPNLYSPIAAGRKRHRSVTITGELEKYLEDEEDDEDETGKKTFFSQLYRDICKLVRVLRILPFLLLCICVTMITIFYDATWTFLIDYMKISNPSVERGPHLLMGVGIVAIFGEIGYGYLGDSKR